MSATDDQKSEYVDSESKFEGSLIFSPIKAFKKLIRRFTNPAFNSHFERKKDYEHC